MPTDNGGMWTLLSLPEPFAPEHEALVRAACAPLPRGRATRRRAREVREVARAALREHTGVGALVFRPQNGPLSTHPLLLSALDWGWTPVNPAGLGDDAALSLAELPTVHPGEALPLLSRAGPSGRALLVEGTLTLCEEVGLMVGDAAIADLSVLLRDPVVPRPVAGQVELSRQIRLEMRALRLRDVRPRPEGGVHVLLSRADGQAADQQCGALRSSPAQPGFSEVTPALPGTLEIGGRSLGERLEDWAGQEVALWLGGPPPLTPEMFGEAERWVL